MDKEKKKKIFIATIKFTVICLDVWFRCLIVLATISYAMSTCEISQVPLLVSVAGLVFIFKDGLKDICKM